MKRVERSNNIIIDGNTYSIKYYHSKMGEEPRTVCLIRRHIPHGQFFEVARGAYSPSELEVPSRAAMSDKALTKALQGMPPRAQYLCGRLMVATSPEGRAQARVGKLPQ